MTETDEILARRAARGEVATYQPPPDAPAAPAGPNYPVLEVRDGEKLLGRVNHQGAAQLEPGVPGSLFLAALYATILQAKPPAERPLPFVPTTPRETHYAELGRDTAADTSLLMATLLERDMALLALKEISRGKGGVAIAKRTLARIKRKVEDIPQ